MTMCEFHESTCNGFGYDWWTDNPIYFSSIDGLFKQWHIIIRLIVINLILIVVVVFIRASLLCACSGSIWRSFKKCRSPLLRLSQFNACRPCPDAFLFNFHCNYLIGYMHS